MKVTYVCMFLVEAKIIGKQIKCQFFFLVFASFVFSKLCFSLIIVVIDSTFAFLLFSKPVLILLIWN
jgi:hypothetical protein